MKINRNISVVLIILSILLFNSTACTEQVKLQNFTSNTGRFSLMVPSIPKIDSVTLSEEGITLTVKTFIIDQKSIGYIVSYVDYPSEFVNINDPDEILNGAKNGLLSKIDGKLISEERISYDNDPAIELHYTAKDNTGRGHSILLLSGYRLYQVGAIGAKNNFPTETVQRYIDSFEIW